MSTRPYVRICPVCETENPPEQSHCRVCATSLADVDFSRSATPREAAEHADEVPAEPLAAAPLLAEQLSVDAPASELMASAELPGIRCPDPDCGQLNPPGSARCQYCDTPLPVDPLLKLPPTLASAAARVAGPSAAATPATTPELAPISLELEQLTDADTHSRALLPTDLAARFRVVRALSTSDDAHLLVVESIADGVTQVLKLFRRGLRPDPELLARVAGAGPHVVELLDHGISDGLAWTLLGYCPDGNLRDVLKRKRLTPETFLRLVEELAAGLNELHARNILHRDLKPENVLVKRESPLTLALTDFGIALLTDDASDGQLFTDAAANSLYAAPEALSGVVDRKADWWSVGMILLEAASGQHPFAGLSHQVIARHLATRPAPIAGLSDPRQEQLCRGLLLRDPVARWGAEEVARWLAHDASLPQPKDSNAFAGVTPFRLKPEAGGGEATSAEELAALFAASPAAWRSGARDLQSGLIATWIKEELRDPGLLRTLTDIMDAAAHDNPDRKLLRFLLAIAPDLPPCWQGHSISLDALVAQASLATKKNDAAEMARNWLASLYNAEAFRLFAETHPELARLHEDWRRARAALPPLWEDMKKECTAWVQQFRARTSRGAVNFDALVYGAAADPIVLPSLSRLHPQLLLMLLRPEFFTAMEQSVRRTVAILAEEAPWLAARLAESPAATDLAERVARLLALVQIASYVRKMVNEAGEQRHKIAAERQKTLDGFRQNQIGDLLLLLLPEMLDDAERRLEVREALDVLRNNMLLIRDLNYPGPEYQRLLQDMRRLEPHADALEAMLFDLDRESVAFEITRQPGVRYGAFAVALLILIIALSVGDSPLVAVAIIATLAAVTYGITLKHRRALKAAEQVLARFRRLCLAIGEKPEETDDSPPGK